MVIFTEISYWCVSAMCYVDHCLYGTCDTYEMTYAASDFNSNSVGK